MGSSSSKSKSSPENRIASSLANEAASVAASVALAETDFDAPPDLLFQPLSDSDFSGQVGDCNAHQPHSSGGSRTQQPLYESEEEAVAADRVAFGALQIQEDLKWLSRFASAPARVPLSSLPLTSSPLLQHVTPCIDLHLDGTGAGSHHGMQLIILLPPSQPPKLLSAISEQTSSESKADKGFSLGLFSTSATSTSLATTPNATVAPQVIAARAAACSMIKQEVAPILKSLLRSIGIRAMFVCQHESWSDACRSYWLSRASLVLFFPEDSDSPSASGAVSVVLPSPPSGTSSMHPAPSLFHPPLSASAADSIPHLHPWSQNVLECIAAAICINGRPASPSHLASLSADAIRALVSQCGQDHRIVDDVPRSPVASSPSLPQMHQRVPVVRTAALPPLYDYLRGGPLGTLHKHGTSPCIILGEAGVGKTSAMCHVACRAAATGWDVHAIWTDAMLGSSRFAYDVLLQLVRSISSRWDIALNADEIKSFRALVVAFLMITRTASLRMRSHALAQGLVYGTGILIVIDALDAIAQGSNDILHALTEMFPPNVRVMCTCRPSSIERRARRVLKHAKIVSMRGIDSKEKAESFIREARWVLGVQDATIDIECAIQGLKAGMEVEPSWLMACVRKRESSLTASLNSGNSSTACLHHLAILQKDSAIFAAAAAWVLAVGSTWGMCADDAWQIVADMSADSSGSSFCCNSISPQLLPEFVGMWTHCMSSSLLCDGPDASADVALGNRSLVAAAAFWAIDSAGGARAFSFAALPGEFDDNTCSKVVMTAAAASSPSLLFGENFLGIDDLEPVAAAKATAAAISAHYSIACHFISKCFVGEKLLSEEWPACRMVVTHLMCCGCIMSASAMVTSPSVIALIARWGGLRWLSDVIHICVQCLMSAEEGLKKLAPSPSRSVVSLPLLSPSCESSSATPPSSSHAHVTGLVEYMRCRLRVIFDFLQAEASLLHDRPELALQHLQHSTSALVNVSSVHCVAARIIHDEALNDLKSPKKRHDEHAVGATVLSGSTECTASPLPVSSGCMTHVEVEEGQITPAVLSSASSSIVSETAAPPLLMLRSYSRPKHVRSSVGVSCVSISGNLADMTAVGLMDGSVQVYLLSEMRQILSLTGHALSVNDVSWSSTGAELVTCADDGIMQLWHIPRPSESERAKYEFVYPATRSLRLLADPPLPLILVRFAPDDNIIATMNSTGTIHLHARARGSWPQCVCIRGPGAALSFAWITGSRLAAFYDGDRLLVWDSSLPYGVGVTVGVGEKGGAVRTNAVQQCVMEGIEGEVTASACAPDGSMIAIGTDDGIMTILRLVDLQVASRIRVEDSTITCVKFASTGSDVVWVHANGRSVLWRYSNSRPTGVFSVPTVVSRAFMLDARVMLNGEVMLVSSSGELWLLTTGALYVRNQLSEVKVTTKGRTVMLIADDDDDSTRVTCDVGVDGDGDQAPSDSERFAVGTEVARASVEDSLAKDARDHAHVHDVIQSIVVEAAHSHAIFEMASALPATPATTAKAAAAAAEANAASAAEATPVPFAAAAFTVAGDIFWPEKDFISGVIHGGHGKKGQSLKTAAERWRQLLQKGECDCSGFREEWRKVDASGNGTVSQSEVLTWIATSHPDLNDSTVIQHAFQAALELQVQQELRSWQDHLSIPAAYPFSTHSLPLPSRRLMAAPSPSLTIHFFPALLSNLVAASRALVLFRLWNGGGAAEGDWQLQQNDWEVGVRSLKRALLSRDELAAEWKLVDADGKGAALFGEFCNWFSMRDQQGWFTELSPPAPPTATALSSSTAIASSAIHNYSLDSQPRLTVNSGLTVAAAVVDASTGSLPEHDWVLPHVNSLLNFDTPTCSSVACCELRQLSEAEASVVIIAGPLADAVVIDSLFVVFDVAEMTSVLQIAVDSISRSEVQSCFVDFAVEVFNHRAFTTPTAADVAESAVTAVADKFGTFSSSTGCTSSDAIALNLGISQPLVQHQQCCKRLVTILDSEVAHMSLPNRAVSLLPEANRLSPRDTKVCNESQEAAVPEPKLVLSLRERMTMFSNDYYLSVVAASENCGDDKHLTRTERETPARMASNPHYGKEILENVNQTQHSGAGLASPARFYELAASVVGRLITCALFRVFALSSDGVRGSTPCTQLPENLKSIADGKHFSGMAIQHRVKPLSYLDLERSFPFVAGEHHKLPTDEHDLSSSFFQPVSYPLTPRRLIKLKDRNEQEAQYERANTN